MRAFVAASDPQAVVEQLKIADLRGMGGAGVPAHQKWNDVWKAKGDAKYVVCNADESEPGTFKDRELLTRHPHLVLEGVILAGLMTGATRGWIYIRHEYAEQIAIMEREIARARELGACGRNIFGGGRDFPVEVFTSPGGYICGEQSALIEAMEDRRGQPRNKPPQLETNGLYDKPTLVSNV
ncbi:MAG: NADH-quinone oxidoreductase subunit L, partial [Planctomycetia bacterium]